MRSNSSSQGTGIRQGLPDMASPAWPSAKSQYETGVKRRPRDEERLLRLASFAQLSPAAATALQRLPQRPTTPVLKPFQNSRRNSPGRLSGYSGSRRNPHEHALAARGVPTRRSSATNDTFRNGSGAGPTTRPARTSRSSLPDLRSAMSDDGPPPSPRTYHHRLARTTPRPEVSTPTHVNISRLASDNTAILASNTVILASNPWAASSPPASGRVTSLLRQLHVLPSPASSPNPGSLPEAPPRPSTPSCGHCKSVKPSNASSASGSATFDALYPTSKANSVLEFTGPDWEPPLATNRPKACSSNALVRAAGDEGSEELDCLFHRRDSGCRQVLLKSSSTVSAQRVHCNIAHSGRLSAVVHWQSERTSQPSRLVQLSSNSAALQRVGRLMGWQVSNSVLPYPDAVPRALADAYGQTSGVVSTETSNGTSCTSDPAHAKCEEEAAAKSAPDASANAAERLSQSQGRCSGDSMPGCGLVDLLAGLFSWR